MKVKLTGGPADGLVEEASANVDDRTETISLLERCQPPVVHYYRQRRRGGRVVKTGNGMPIYDYDITLPREREEAPNREGA